MTHSNPRRNMIPQAVLMRPGIKVVNTAKPKDARNVVKRNMFNVVKASACWVWMPKNRVIDHVSKNIREDMKNINEDHFCSDGCTGSGEARVQQRKRRIQRRVQQKQKDQEDEVFGRILSAKKMKVTDILNMDKNKPKRTKPEHEIGSVQEIEAEDQGLWMDERNTPEDLEPST
ncbi:hypothetical protein Tco_1025542 [Tanacetum coccineum]